MFAEKEVRNLQSRVAELEQQLVEARAAISAREAESWGNDAWQKAEELHAIIQTLHDPVLVYDQNGVISMANASAIRAHGFDPTGHHRRESNQTLLVRYPDGRIMHSDDLPSARALKGEIVIDEALTITNSHGQELSLLVTSSPLFVNGVQKGAVSVWHDITKSTNIEKVLRASEAKYRSLVETAFEGVWVVDTDGHTTFVNQRMAEMLNYDSPDDLMDRSAFDFVPAEDLDQLKTKFRLRLNSRSREQYDVRLRCRDGSIIWASVASNNVLDEQGNAVGRMALFMDITQRKQTEDRLRAARDEATWLARLPGENPNPVVRVSDTGIVLYHNPPAAKLPGWTCALNKPLPSPLLPLAWQSMTRSQIVEQDISLGGRFYSISVVPIIGERYANLYGKDITGRKQAEDALRESETRFHSLADSMPQLVWTALPDGTVDYYNSRYREYQEIRQVKTTAWEWAPVLHPDDVQLTVDAWTHSVQTGEIYQIEHRVRMSDGSYRWHLSRGVPMLDEKGQIFRWFGTATDIHDTKLAEEQLKVYTERLERSNRELEQFAFMASHDLQEPLRKIEVFGDLLLESSKSLNGRERNYLGRMRDAAKRMRDMVDGLLQLSRVMTQGKPFVQVSLSRVMEDVLYDLETQIRRTGGTVDVETLPSIDGDPLQLRQLIQNLISNALKYHQPDTAPEIQVHAEQLPGKVQIFVKDNGIGFEPGDAERIFQPFLRLVGRSQYEGSGMGLAICRRIVERHGGEIAARSQPGQGATFVVSLPMYQAGSGKDAKDEEPGTAPDRRG